MGSLQGCMVIDMHSWSSENVALVLIVGMRSTGEARGYEYLSQALRWKGSNKDVLNTAGAISEV
jgi:hypothetical protein